MTEDDRWAFIIHIWRERRELSGQPPEWRGLIEQVGSSQRSYFRRLDEIDDFIRLVIEREPPGGGD